MSRISPSWGWLAATLAVVAGCLALLAPHAASEQAASAARSAQAGYLDVAEEHTCAVLVDRTLRCWGNGVAGRLGTGGEGNVLAPAAVGPINLGPGRSARAVAAGRYHTCAILDDGSVKCWGFGANGRLGYGNTNNVLTPATAPPVDLGAGRTAVAITAGFSHTCAILDTGAILCWGNGVSGRLGYGNQNTIGDNETPASPGPVNIGAGHRAVAISAGDFHTCAVRDDGQLFCWGFGQSGQLGYGNTADVGDDETPAQVGPVPLPPGRTVRSVASGKGHTCAILDDGSARCWGFGANGRLGYGGTADVTSAAAAGPIALGSGRTAIAIGAGEAHSCAILDDGTVRCWGFGGNGRLGYPGTGGNPPPSIGDNPGETPASAGPVSIGAARTARAIAVGFSHTCALLDDGTARCWGFGGSGRLGYGNEDSVGDDEAPGAVGPIALGGAMAGSVADLRLTMSSNASQLPIGGRTSITVTVSNAGADPTSGVVVGIPDPSGLSFESAASTQGSYDGITGRWDVGSVAVGGRAVLQLTTRADAAGAQLVVAEVVASALHDPTSTPNNGADEDDRALLEIAVPNVQGGPRASRLLPRGLVFTVKRVPKRGKLRALAVNGRLLPPKGRPRACSGRVLVKAAVGKRSVAQKRVALRFRKRACRFTATLKPSRTRSARSVKVTARFLGSVDLRPRSAKALKVRIR
jgi:uncharacterized repeat protein (TIGR01451 family)